MGDATKGAEREGRKAGGMLSTGLKRSVQATIGGGALFAGIAGKKGLDRLMGIEDARASLSGLGHDAKAVDAIMQNALDSVRGTAFGMADAGKLAASTVAAGVKPGKELERTLKLVGDAATIANTDLGAMGGVFAKVAASNKLQMDSINQLHDAGVPALQLVAKEMGVTADEASKMASKGQIDFATFQNAMEAGLGGAALKSGDTTRGAFANMMASVGRIGANFLGSIFPMFREGFSGIIDALAPMEEKATAAGQKLGEIGNKYGPPLLDFLGDVVSGVKNTVKFFDQNRGVAIGLIATIVALVAVTKAHAAAMAVQAAGGLAKYIKGIKIVTAMTRVWAAVQWLLTAAFKASPIGRIIQGITLLAAAVVFAWKKFPGFRAAVLTAFDAVKRALSAAWSFVQPVFAAIASWVGKALPKVFGFLKGYVSFVFKVIGTYIKVWWTVVKAVFAVVKWYVTTVLAPIFSWLWNNVIKPVFGWIGRRISDVWNNIIKPVFKLLRAGVSKVGDIFGSVVRGVRGAWNKLGDIVQGPINTAIRVINGFIRAINKIPGVEIPLILTSAQSAPKGVARGALLRRAAGGPIFGPGTGTSDDVLMLGSNGEHMWTAAEVRAVGGHGKMEQLRAAVRSGMLHLPAFAKGGPVVPGRGNRHGSGYPWASWAGDFPNPIGTPVRAWKAGAITAVRSLAGSYGKHIRMRHNDGSSSLYAHLSRFAVAAGDRVRQGAKIGEVGSTGNSTGPHLHFEAMNGLFSAVSGAVGSLKNAASSVWDTLKGTQDKIGGWIKSKLLDKANIGGLFGNVSGLFRKVGEGVKSHVTGKLFDSGGIASGTGLLAKNTLSPERVLSPRQTAAFESALARGFGPSGGPRFHVVRADITGAMDAIEVVIEESIDNAIEDGDRQDRRVRVVSA